jgi:hypothetical protein
VPLARTTYVALALGTIAVGLMVHLRGGALGPVARDVLGDALWATMIAWWIGAAAPSVRIGLRGVAALAVWFAVEASQLFRAPVIDAARATTLGRLVLGTGFDPRDLLAYAAGVAAAMLLEVILTARGARARVGT